ncbi:MAG: redox-regulated molecular chaperone Hsp33 [Legionella sp.]|nr:MAG: redox-regulated molecular chaperone Hsp33 [Legionella sp.]
MHAIDTLQRFLFEHAAIRGELIHLHQAYQSISQQRDYPPRVKHLLGEALMTCALLVGSIKFEGEISLQFQGDHRLPLMLVQCNHLLHIRGFANFAENQSDADYEEAFLTGKMVINMTPHHQTQTYQSIVPLTSSSMSDNLMHYFAQSEQLPSKVWFAVSDDHAAGVILQLMPEQNSQQREQFWEYAIHIGHTITPEELLSLDNATLLHRLYHETELRLYPERDIQFRCRCTHEKMKQVLSVLGEQEAQALLQEKGQIDINCEFCNQHYSFDPIDITLLFRK